ncbi:MAG: condensation domain-containing protein, partial [Bacteroidota bacterium]
MTSIIQSSVLPLTQNQTAIWLDELLFEKSPMYNIGAYYEIKGHLKVELFVEALRKVVAEHDVFGLSIEQTANGQALQRFTPQADYRMPVLDFSDQENPVEACKQWLEAQFQEAFDIAQAPLYQFALLKAGAGHYFWLMKMHHLSVDGWGYSVFTNQLVANYKALTGAPLPKMPETFAFSEYVQNELDYYGSAQFETDKSYWLQKFESLP